MTAPAPTGGLSWLETAMGHVYSIPAWPSALLAAGFALALYVAVTDGLELRRRAGSMRIGPAAAALAAGLSTFALLWVGAAFFGFSTWNTERGPWGARVFSDQLTFGLALLLGTIFLSGLSLHLRRATPETAARRSPGARYGVLFVLCLPWLHQGIRLLDPRGLPFIDGPDRAFIQVGRERSLEFKVVGEGYGHFELEPIGRIDATTVRAEPVEVRARGRGLTVSRPVTLVVAEERGTPLFPLRVGNTWKYVPFTAPGVHTHEGGTRPPGQERAFPDKAVTFSILREGTEPGLRYFELEKRTSDGAADTVRLFAFGGEVRIDKPDGPSLITLEQEPAPEGASPGAVSCRFAPFDDQRCACLPAPRSDEGATLTTVGPGPELCDYAPGSGGLQMTRALLVLGVSVLTRSEELPPFLRFKQVAWTPGAPDAPAAP